MHTLIDLFESAVSRFPENTYLYERQGAVWAKASYSQVRDQIYTFAAGLLSLGAVPGDRIAILAEGRNSWIIGELGLLYVGCCSVPLSIKLSPSEAEFRLKHSGARKIIVSGAVGENNRYQGTPSGSGADHIDGSRFLRK